MIRVTGINIFEKEICNLPERIWKNGKSFHIEVGEMNKDGSPDYIKGTLRSTVETDVVAYFDVKIYFEADEFIDTLESIDKMLSDTNSNKLLGMIHAIAGMIHNNTF